MTTTTGTAVELDPDLPAIHITREFAAPPDAVFRAHTDPGLLQRWLGPHDITMEIEHFDCRTGGAFRYVHHRDGEAYRFFGSYHEVRPEDHVLVQTFGFELAPDSVALERMELHDLGDGRTRLVNTARYDSFVARDAMVAGGMEEGIEQGYERLDRVLRE